VWRRYLTANVTMKKLPAIIILAAVMFIPGCGLRDSQVRIRSLTDADCRALLQAVIPLCTAAEPTKDEDRNDSNAWLRGASIPASLMYLKPQRVFLTNTKAIIELWHTPAGDDSIYVMDAGDGVWQISVHQGDYLNKDRLIWTSKRKTN